MGFAGAGGTDEHQPGVFSFVLCQGEGGVTGEAVIGVHRKGLKGFWRESGEIFCYGCLSSALTGKGLTEIGVAEGDLVAQEADTLTDGTGGRHGDIGGFHSRLWGFGEAS